MIILLNSWPSQSDLIINFTVQRCFLLKYKKGIFVKDLNLNSDSFISFKIGDSFINLSKWEVETLKDQERFSIPTHVHSHKSTQPPIRFNSYGDVSLVLGLESSNHFTIYIQN